MGDLVGARLLPGDIINSIVANKKSFKLSLPMKKCGWCKFVIDLRGDVESNGWNFCGRRGIVDQVEVVYNRGDQVLMGGLLS